MVCCCSSSIQFKYLNRKGKQNIYLFIQESVEEVLLSNINNNKKCTLYTKITWQEKIIEQKKSLQNKFFNSKKICVCIQNIQTHKGTWAAHTRYISHPACIVDTFKINIFSQFISSSSSTLKKKQKKSPFYIPFSIDTREMIMMMILYIRKGKESLESCIYLPQNN